MFKRVAAFYLLAVLCFLPCLNAMAEETDVSFSLNGAAWGMMKDEVRSLMDTKPFQEPTAQTGHSALAYQTEMEGMACVIQYNFLPAGELYNIEIMAPDAEKAFYAMLTESFTSRYGDPRTEDDASLEVEDPAAVMMALR